MPHGVIPEWRKRQARKHAAYAHRCVVCGRECRGNGGYSAHEKACIKRAIPGIDPAMTVGEMRREYLRRRKAGLL